MPPKVHILSLVGQAAALGGLYYVSKNELVQRGMCNSAEANMTSAGLSGFLGGLSLGRTVKAGAGGSVALMFVAAVGDLGTNKYMQWKRNKVIERRFPELADKPKEEQPEATPEGYDPTSPKIHPWSWLPIRKQQDNDYRKYLDMQIAETVEKLRALEEEERQWQKQRTTSE